MWMQHKLVPKTEVVIFEFIKHKKNAFSDHGSFINIQALKKIQI